MFIPAANLFLVIIKHGKQLSKFLRRSVIIFITKGFRTIVFNPDCSWVTMQEYLTLVPGYG